MHGQSCYFTFGTIFNNKKFMVTYTLVVEALPLGVSV